jgi:hypothetical protein
VDEGSNTVTEKSKALCVGCTNDFYNVKLGDKPEWIVEWIPPRAL